jgi:hypothetical protein
MFLLVRFFYLNLAQLKAWVKENFHDFQLQDRFVHSSWYDRIQSFVTNKDQVHSIILKYNKNLDQVHFISSDSK